MKKIFAILLILALAVSAGACGDKKPAGPSQVTPQPRPTQAPEPQQTPGPVVQTLSLSVDADSGEMTIVRPEPHQLVPMGAKNTWTVFV